jgi:putative transposase
MESFFSSLKTERTARKIYRTRHEAKADFFDYIEYLSPMEFERKVGLV